MTFAPVFTNYVILAGTLVVVGSCAFYRNFIVDPRVSLLDYPVTTEFIVYV